MSLARIAKAYDTFGGCCNSTNVKLRVEPDFVDKENRISKSDIQYGVLSKDLKVSDAKNVSSLFNITTKFIAGANDGNGNSEGKC
jgi:hypothetical protein